MPEISILTADGRTRTDPLQGDRVGLGRAASNQLCFPDDTGLSRQHLFFEREADSWWISDPGSKNGTLINNERLKARRKLKTGDRIHAGHLMITFGSNTRPLGETVVFVDTGNERSAVSRQLKEVLQPAKASSTPAPVSADRIGALIRAGQELASHGSLTKLFPTILNLAIEAVAAERGVLLAFEGESLEVKATSGGSFRISSGVRDRVIREKTSILVNDVSSSESFRGMQSLVQQQVRMLMTVPLQTSQQVLGLIYVDSPALSREFTEEDLNLLTVMANVAAIRIEHARLAEVEQAERVLAKDLEQAAVIQQSLLPSRAPFVPGMDLAGYNAPSRSVGGDYYDFLTYPDGKVGIALGDVSGKAMPAALLMTSLQARFRVLAEEITDVADLLNRLNRHTAANSPPNRFVTFFFILIDPDSGHFTYSNAGHNPPYLLRSDGELVMLEGGGLVLGIFPQAKYIALDGVLQPGEAIVIFSDGVTEATTAADEEFGEDRLKETLVSNCCRSAGEIVQAVTDAVSKFVAGAPAADDLTMVVVRRNPLSSSSGT